MMGERTKGVRLNTETLALGIDVIVHEAQLISHNEEIM